MVRAHNLNSNIHVAIVGGNGFIGRHLIHRLAKYSNIRIWSLDRQVNKLCIDDTAFHAQLNQINMNVEAEDVIQSWLIAHPVDAVVYLAGYDNPTDGYGPSTLKDIQSLVGLTKTVESLDKLLITEDDHRPYFLYVSSAAVYGRNRKQCSTETDKEFPSNHYGMSKLLAEDIVKRCCTRYSVPFSILRPTEVYGKRHFKELQDRTLWPGFLTYYIDQAVLQSETIDVFSPKTAIDLVNVNYVAEVIEKFILERQEGVYNVGSGESFKLGDLSKRVCELFGEDLTAEVKFNTRLDLDNLVVDCSKIHSLVPYESEEYKLDAFIIDYIKLRRFELAKQRAIEMFLSQPLLVDLTDINAKQAFIKRRKNREIEIRNIKKIAGEQFFDLKLGCLQEQAQELLPELQSGQEKPIELPITGELLEKVNAGEFDDIKISKEKGLDIQMQVVLPDVPVKSGKAKIDEILGNLRKK